MRVETHHRKMADQNASFIISLFQNVKIANTRKGVKIDA